MALLITTRAGVAGTWNSRWQKDLKQWQVGRPADEKGQEQTATSLV